MADDSNIKEVDGGAKISQTVIPELENDIPWMPPAPTETTRGKFIRKTKENPLVPIGAAATVTALTLGLVNFKRGNSLKQQFFMRARIVAQGFTIVAIVGGLAATMVSKSSDDSSSENPSQ